MRPIARLARAGAWLIGMAVLELALFEGGLDAAAGATAWATGADFQRRLAQPVDIVWAGKPLREALRSLGDTVRVAVLLDRRVDPGQVLDLRLDQVPLESALEEIARSCDLGLSLFGPVVYFGPRPVASQLRTIAAMRTEEVGPLPAAAGRRLLRRDRLAWPDFALPRELLRQLVEKNGLVLDGLERVPHDLWAAADLPDLSLVDRLTLIATQFDLTLQISSDGSRLTLVPISGEVGVVRSYPGGPQPEATAERFATIVPNARIKVVGQSVYVQGLVEEHDLLRGPPRPAVPPVPDLGATRIQKLSVRDVPVGALLETMAERLKLELKIDHQALQRAGVSLQQRVSVDIRDATVDEALRQAIQQTPLRFRRQGRVVEIGPAMGSR